MPWFSRSPTAKPAPPRTPPRQTHADDRIIDLTDDSPADAPTHEAPRVEGRGPVVPERAEGRAEEQADDEEKRLRTELLRELRDIQNMDA